MIEGVIKLDRAKNTEENAMKTIRHLLDSYSIPYTFDESQIDLNNGKKITIGAKVNRFVLHDSIRNQSIEGDASTIIFQLYEGWSIFV